MKQLEDVFFSYWGKADPNYPGEQKWHPLVYHSLDVAAVAAIMAANALWQRYGIPHEAAAQRLQRLCRRSCCESGRRRTSESLLGAVAARDRRREGGSHRRSRLVLC